MIVQAQNQRPPQVRGRHEFRGIGFPTRRVFGKLRAERMGTARQSRVFLHEIKYFVVMAANPSRGRDLRKNALRSSCRNVRTGRPEKECHG